MLFFVDWRKLIPVKQTAIADNPFVPHAASVLTNKNMFWTKDADAINHRIELTEAKRCEGVWLLAYIQECRYMYNFIHRFPTRVAGSWLPLPPGVTENEREYKLLCGDANCYALCEDTWEKNAVLEQVGQT